MIQAGAPARLHYATRLIAEPGSRPARAVESAAAETLLRELAVDQQGQGSKAHARGMVAAAFASQGRVGIDIEFHAPGRDIAAIARWLMDAEAPDEAAAYRVFTFREAYFKAMAAWPPQPLLRAVAAGEALEGVLLETPAAGFTLALVWEGDVALSKY